MFIYLYNPLVIIGNHLFLQCFVESKLGSSTPSAAKTKARRAVLLLFEVAHFVVSHW